MTPWIEYADLGAYLRCFLLDDGPVLIQFNFDPIHLGFDVKE